MKVRFRHLLRVALALLALSGGARGVSAESTVAIADPSALEVGCERDGGADRSSIEVPPLPENAAERHVREPLLPSFRLDPGHDLPVDGESRDLPIRSGSSQDWSGVHPGSAAPPELIRRGDLARAGAFSSFTTTIPPPSRA